MERHQISFWLDYGTLLGAYRDGDLVSWMGDVDLGMFDSSWSELRSGFQELSAIGFEIHEKRFCVGDVTFHTVKFRRNGVSVDLSIYVASNGRALDIHDRLWRTKLSLLALVYQQLPFSPALRFALRARNQFFSFIFRNIDILPPKTKFGLRYASRWGLWRPSYYCAEIPISFYSDFTRIYLGGREYSAPSTTKEYLTYLYGPRWRKPDPAYRTLDAPWFNFLVTERPIECPLEPSPRIDRPH